MNTSPIRLSISLFSLTQEWLSGDYTLERLVTKARQHCLGFGLEMIGFQSLRGYPYLPDAEVNRVKCIIEENGFEPVCLGADLDVALRRDRRLNVEECVASLTAQIEMAKKLGFSRLVLQLSVKAAVLQKLLPVAEKAGVRVGVEIQGALHVKHPAVLALRELFYNLDSPLLGFVADFSTSMRHIPEVVLQSFREEGVSDGLIALTKDIWRKSVPMSAKFAELEEKASQLNATPHQVETVNTAFLMYGRQAVEDWREIVPQTVHLHGKFYHVAESGEEASIDYAGIIKVFYEGGYKGHLSSEFKRTACHDPSTGFEQVFRHQKLCAGILEKLEKDTLRKTVHQQINTV